MPELPEVETIARILREGKEGIASITGKRITRATIWWERCVASPSAGAFCQRIQGQVIEEISRRGKYIVITLTKDTLLIHLRMSGDLRVEEGCSDPAERIFHKHDRAALWLEGGTCLVFEDTRKFGRLWLLEDPQEELGKLGPEPLAETLSAEEFHQMLSQHRRQLKPLLMEQSFLAGLGNIYTDEALFRAHLHPLLVSSNINKQQAASLLNAIRETLQEGIRRNGTSIDWVYRGGDFQNQLCVYGRTGEACRVCGTPIERMVVGQRGTHFCPHCQPEPKKNDPENS